MSQSFKDHSHSLLPSIESSTGDESNSTRTEPLVKFCEPKYLSSKVLEKVFLEIENGSKPSVVADKYKIGYCTLWKLVSIVAIIVNNYRCIE
jgi:hypothetical protein